MWTIIAALAGSLAPASDPVTLPSYEAVDKLDHYATRDVYEKAVADDRFVMERVAYPSDESPFTPMFTVLAPVTRSCR